MGRQRQRGPQRGADVHVNLQIKFEEAAFGVETEGECPEVKSAPIATVIRQNPVRLSTPVLECNGTGQVQQVQQSAFDVLSMSGHVPDAPAKGRL